MDFSFHRYDTSSSTGDWTELKELDEKYYGSGEYLMAAHVGSIFVMSDTYEVALVTLCFNPMTNKWHRKANLRIAEIEYACRLSNMKLFVRNSMLTAIHVHSLKANIYIYDLPADQWNVSKISTKKKTFKKIRIQLFDFIFTENGSICN